MKAHHYVPECSQQPRCLAGATYSIAGIPIEVVTGSPDVLERFFESFKLSSGEPRFRFQIDVHSTPSDLELPEPAFVGLDGYAGMLLGESEFFSFDLLNDSAAARISFVVANDRVLWRRRILPIALGIIGPEIGVTPIHAATLSRDSKAVMICGASGSGKSTLSAALVDRGWKLVADDWSFVRAERYPTVFGFAPSLKLMPDAVTFLPWLRRYQPDVTLNGEVAYEVELSFKPRECSPTAMVFLSRSHAPVKKRRVGPGEAFELLSAELEPIPTALKRSRENRERAIRVLSNLDCWATIRSGPPAECAQELEEIVGAAR